MIVTTTQNLSTMEPPTSNNISKSPHIKRVLKSYQLSAGNTMSGPNSLNLPNTNNTSNNSSIGSLAGVLTNIYKKRNISLDSHSNLPPLIESPTSIYCINGKKDMILKSNTTTITPVINNNNTEQPRKNGFNINFPPPKLIEKESPETTLILNKSPAISPPSSQLQIIPQLPPILTAPDRSKTEKKETVLEGETIACFIVGGEPRLCFPQILTSVLRGFSLHQINQVCDELQIFCSRCSTEQLELLKLTSVIPKSAPSCGLITKTDAERLVTSLLHRNPPKAAVSVLSAVNRPQDTNQPNSISHFRIYHECFGKGRGVLLPHLYEKPDSLCIECIDCHGLFSPSRFVSHSHQPQENRTCHWGFDPAKWRNYIMVAKDQENRDKIAKTLQDFKNRFEFKRKEFGSSQSLEEGNIVIKRIRYSSEPVVSSIVQGGNHFHQPSSNLPTKKRLPFLNNYSNDIQYQAGSNEELNSVKKLLLTEMSSPGAEIVINLLDKMNKRIIGLEQEICKTQQGGGGYSPNGSFSESPKAQQSQANPSMELQSKVSSLETELHSLKKQLLRRHGEELK